MKVLVTGSTGKLGRALVDRLAGEAHVELVLPTRHQPTSIGPVWDLADADSIHDVVSSSRPDAIVHLAAVTGRACESDPELADSINAEATRILAMTARDCGVTRFVFASTSAVYGDRYTTPVPENAVLDTRSSYGATKRRAEAAISALDSTSALSSVVLRIFNIYGREFDDSLVQRLRNSTAESPVAINGLDEFVRDYVHVDDVVSALILGLRHSLPAGTSVFNIASGVSLSNRELIARLQASQPVHYQVGKTIQSYSAANIARAREQLEFVPERIL